METLNKRNARKVYSLKVLNTGVILYSSSNPVFIEEMQRVYLAKGINCVICKVWA